MSALPLSVHVFRRSHAILGESLVAQTIQSQPAMWWCDITAGLIHRSMVRGQRDGSSDATIALPAPVCSFHPAVVERLEGFVVSLADSVVLTDSDGRIIRQLAHIDHGHPGLRLNEGKVDPYGRWVTGSMNLTTGDPDGAFYSVSEQGDVRVLRGGITVANGLEWSLDGSRIFFTDTGVKSIYTGAYSPDGEVTDIEVFIHGEAHDGLTIDRNGNFWSAIYGAGCVVHYDSAGVEKFRIDLPAPNVTSVAFGGAGRSTLYVTSARENLTEEQLEAHPLSGSVFAIETDTAGRPPNVFGS
ncbi:SMP-30/gluconolactonase/LRE family protein [Paeniglutamicibacter antarcticus]|uniref:SMP-30/gluconolactonase/LRE family protein n=1 Tax=Arthrobacter terrae TaxID=2935737 RepID=A0A931GAF0_9MICC|nr:SMP-30/gluconolactonase/LRE family protein [Arthrobacter terrae]MBG0739662.1 SMP-30/gluconolactonase/LRE family protein [Arthrobacter terrae]